MYSGLRTTSGRMLATWSTANTRMRDWIVTHIPGYLPAATRVITRSQLHACLHDMLDRIAEINDRFDYESQQCTVVAEGLIAALRLPVDIEYWEEER